MFKRNLVLIYIGFICGVLFSMFDTVTNNVDVAPVEADIDFIIDQIIDNFDFVKTLIYGIIGLIIMVFIISLFNLLKKNKFILKKCR